MLVKRLLFVAGLVAGFLLMQPFSFPVAPRQNSAAVSLSASSTQMAEVPATGHTPILVYHIVRPAYASDSTSVRKLAVTPELFDQEMAYLKINGYTVIPLSQLDNYWYGESALPAHPVVLTFDDAWEDQFVYAFPILKKYNYTATFFVPSGFPESRASFMTWDQLRQLVAAGMTIGDHSRTHPYLTKVTATTTLWAEVYESKLTLEQKLGVSVTDFAYPFGMFNDRVIAAVKRAGYRSARGDYLGAGNATSTVYKLSSLNAPTTLAVFKTYFPPVRQ